MLKFTNVKPSILLALYQLGTSNSTSTAIDFRTCAHYKFLFCFVEYFKTTVTYTCSINFKKMRTRHFGGVSDDESGRGVRTHKKG